MRSAAAASVDRFPRRRGLEALTRRCGECAPISKADGFIKPDGKAFFGIEIITCRERRLPWIPAKFSCGQAVWTGDGPATRTGDRLSVFGPTTQPRVPGRTRKKPTLP